MKLSLKLDLLLIVALLAIMNIPFLSGNTPIAWDTFKGPYQEFSITYSSVYHDGQLPLWLPYSYYGIPDYFWLAALSAVNFLFIGIGKLFHIQNVLLLFRASLFAEQLVSVFGMYLLGGRIFQKRTTVILTSLAWMATFSVYRQVQLNFRSVYLLPLILFWIVLFFQQRAAFFLWLGGITMLLSVPGSAFYPAVIEFYCVAIFALVMFIANVGAVKAVFSSSWRNLLAFFVLLGVTALFLFYLRTFSGGVEVAREGRGSNLYVPIASYLSTWSSWSPVGLAASFLYGIIPEQFTNQYEYVFYIGLLPLAGAIAAALYERRPVWLAIVIGGVFTYALSLRGLIAAVLYFLPYMDITRYIAVLGTIPFRSFLILAAGFGLDMDLSIAQSKKIGIWLLGLAVVIDIAGLTAAGTAGTLDSIQEVLVDPGAYLSDFKLFIARIAVYLAVLGMVLLITGRKKPSEGAPIRASRLLQIAIVALMVADLATFRINYEGKIHTSLKGIEKQVASLPSLQKLRYQPARLSSPPLGAAQAADAATSEFQGINGWAMESFLQLDRCVPDAVTAGETGEYEVFSASLGPLVERDLVLSPSGKASLGLRQVYGCESPKLRVITNVLVSPTNKDAASDIQRTKDLSNLLILSGQMSKEKDDLGNPPALATIQVKRFSHNDVLVEVELQNEPGWLVYSDSYHPDWKATLNGEPQTIERAYLAFKAVRLAQGKNVVLFEYGSIWKRVGYTLLAVVCGAAALALLCAVFVVLLFESRSYSRPRQVGPKRK